MLQALENLFLDLHILLINVIEIDHVVAGGDEFVGTRGYNPRLAGAQAISMGCWSRLATLTASMGLVCGRRHRHSLDR